MPAVEPDLSGVWKDSERGILVRLAKAGHSSWLGTAVASPRPPEVGKVIYRALRFDPVEKKWVGELLKPEDGQVTQVTITLTSPTAMEAVAKVFIFSKTLHMTRQP